MSDVEDIENGLNIVCTDRGQHDYPVRIRSHMVAADQPDDGDSHAFRCPKCGRAPRVSLSTWPQIVTAYQRAGRAELDISYLG